MIKALICFFCVGAYIGVALALYALLNKFDPEPAYNDSNKVAAGFWPITAPLMLICAVGYGIGAIMDLIREYQSRKPRRRAK